MSNKDLAIHELSSILYNYNDRGMISKEELAYLLDLIDLASEEEEN